MAPEVARAAAHEAALRALAESRVARARRVALYASLPDELSTRPLFEALTARGAPCLFPRIAAGEGLEFARVERWEELRPGRYGVPEPPEGAPAPPLARGDVVFVPGLAFDLVGHRLGRGGGHYDRRFPPDAPDPPLLLGFAYELQLVDAVPCDASDRTLDGIVTECAVRWAREATR